METSKPLYTIPRIDDRNGDTIKTWRVEYYFRHPITKIQKRFIAPTENANRIKDSKARWAFLEGIRMKIYSELQNGYCPFPDVNLKHLPKAKYTTIIDALETVLAHKATFVSKETTLPVYRSRHGAFKDWLTRKGLHTLMPNQIDPNHIFDFLSHIMIEKRNGARSRNNYLVDIRSAFECMKQINRNWIKDNPCEFITKLPTASITHKPYSDEDFSRVADYLKENDIYFYYYLRCLVYFSFRPIEIVKIQVRDINLTDRTITLEADKTKQKERKIKRIFGIHFQDFIELDLKKLPPDYYLFTKNGEPGDTRTPRDHFTNKFKKVKSELGLEKNQTMYSLRHTFIISLVKNAKKGENLNLKEVMKISGHKSIQSFQNYLQKYLDEPISDISDKFDLKF